MNYWHISAGLDIVESNHADLEKNVCSFRLIETKCHELTRN